MKTPITYYGGKQKMLKHILPMIPKHTCYVEPFVGGGAVFWAKQQAKVEWCYPQITQTKPTANAAEKQRY
jgi:DNA adenine methylase